MENINDESGICLRISRESQPDDVTETLELGLKSGLIGIEGKVGNKNGVRLRRLLITVCLRTILAGGGFRAGSRVVNVETATVKIGTILGFESGLGG